MLKQISRRLNTLHPAFLLLLSYLTAIALGTGLLMLPAATLARNIHFIDALFTATSAVCVTGLTVLDTGSDYTLLGQGIILVLIQLGGLGIMTLSVLLFRLIGLRVRLQYRMAVQEVFSHTPRKDIYRLLRSILIFTAVMELIGVLLLTLHWAQHHPLGKALYLGVFHSVSAFCNAGFSLFETSFMKEQNAVLLNMTICGLIVLGGLGFPVVYEIYFKAVNNRSMRLSIQTKAVLWTSGGLILLGVLILGVTEADFLGTLSYGDRILSLVFQSITCRTAGFNTVGIGSLTSAGLAFMMFLMFFGASPGSCGGGVKTTTLAVLAAFSWSRLKGMTHVNLFKRTLPQDTVTKSVSVLLLSTVIICAALFLILITDLEHGAGASEHRRFLSLLFETTSAFGTVGLSMGATPRLNDIGKLIIICVMLIGRVGVPAFAYIIAGPASKKGLEFAQENLMIG